MSDESTRRARLERLLAETPEAARSRAAAEAERLTDNRPLVVHGCGGMGRRLANALVEGGRPPIAMSDSDPAKWGTDLAGITIMSPAEAIEEFGETAAFVVAKWSPGDGYLDVRRGLMGLGATLVVPLPVFMWRYPDHMLPHYLFALPDDLLRRADEILAAYDLLADGTSRDEFLGQLDWRLTLDYNALLPPKALGLQYFDPDVIEIGSHERLVDCGAFDGDTIRSFLAATGGYFESLDAFEPDPGTFLKLREYVGGLPAAIRGRISLSDIAVGGEHCTLHFDGAGSTSARVTDVGDVEVSCERLDDVVESATYIKMDIEGAETGAILGARRLLADPRTRLAVSLYHRPSDFFELVLLVHSVKPEARLHCRGYMPDGLEFVLYATPE